MRKAHAKSLALVGVVYLAIAILRSGAIAVVGFLCLIATTVKQAKEKSLALVGVVYLGIALGLIYFGVGVLWAERIALSASSA